MKTPQAGRVTAWLTLLLCSLFVSGCSNDSKPETALHPVAERLDVVLESYLAHERFSGSVLLARDGEPILEKAYGLANWEAGKPPLDVETPFNIGSIGKLFTQTLVLQHVDSGRWSLEDTVADLWPDSGVPNAELITIRHLLSHQSGLSSYFMHPEYSLAQRTMDDVLGLIRTQDLAFDEPGTSVFYSNSAFWVLAALLEQYDQNGRGWYEIYQQEIFNVAGMDGIRAFQPDEEVEARPHGYFFNPVGERSDRTAEDARPGPDGGLYATVADLWAFHQASVDETWYSRQMFEASLKTYGPLTLPGCSAGLTWEVCDLEGIQVITKGGATEGGGAEYIQFEYEGHEYVLVMLSNFSNVPLMIYQDVIRYMFELPGGRLAEERPSVVVHRALEAGELDSLKADFTGWASAHGVDAAPFDLYFLASHYANNGAPDRARALLEINVHVFDGHPPSAAFLNRLTDE